MKKRYIICFSACLAVFAVMLVFFSRLVEPKYMSLSREGNLIADYYTETDAGRTHDVIFIGDCEAYSSFIPPLMYEEFGFCSFVRGSPSQSMAQSYYLLKEVFKYESPDAIVFSVYGMTREGSASEAYNRMTLDGMRLSYEKIAAVRESAYGDESILSYYLPLLRFHERIYGLTEDDFKYLFRRPAVSHNGYFMQKGIVPQSEPARDDAESAEMPLPSENFICLDKMLALCRESGAELILVKTPTDSWRYPWYDSWSAEIAEYAEENVISYYDLTESADEIGIDMSLDSYDGGLHLNVYGAEKVSKYFGEILQNEHGILGQNDEVWDEKVKEYYKERD